MIHEDKPDEIKKIFEDARNEGVDISYDVIANVTGGGAIFQHLMYLLRPWYLTAGSDEQFIKNLQDKDYVEMMKKEMVNSRWYFTNENALPGVEHAILITENKNPAYLNKTFAQIMEETGMNYQETFIAVIKEDLHTKINYGTKPNPTDTAFVKKLFDCDYAMPCSDSYAANEDTILGFAEPLEMTAHSNAYSYAVRYLKDYRRNSLEDSIYAMTGLPAERFNISKRGVLKEGNYADIVILDLQNLDVNNNLVDPRSFPSGIEYVFVNGEMAVNKGNFTGTYSGRVLLRED